MDSKDKHIERLVVVNEALATRLVALQRRKMERNTQATANWRRKAYYYKSRVDVMKKFIKQHGLEVPKTSGGTNESSN